MHSDTYSKYIINTYCLRYGTEFNSNKSRLHSNSIIFNNQDKNIFTANEYEYIEYDNYYCESIINSPGELLRYNK